MRVGKESAGIQSAPLAKIGTPLTTKVKDSPHSSGSRRSSTVRKPDLVTALVQDGFAACQGHFHLVKRLLPKTIRPPELRIVDC